jgi:hypothetical protein
MKTTLEKTKNLQVVDFSKKTIPVKRARHAFNPFLAGVVSTFSDKRVTVDTRMQPQIMEMDAQTGEITRIPGQIVRTISADREGFVKLYTAQLDAFFELTGCAKIVIKYLIFLHQKEKNKHLVVLHQLFALEDGYDIPKSTWHRGITELLRKEFIAAASAVNSYYLNPAIFFNGDRTVFVTEIKRRRTDEDHRAELEARGQERLLP